MNYNMFMKLGNSNLRQHGTLTVTAADGGNLGAIGITTCKICLGTKIVKQDFIVCTYLKQNLILGIHFACSNCTGVKWTKEGTRILTLRRKNVIEVGRRQARNSGNRLEKCNYPPKNRRHLSHRYQCNKKMINSCM